MSPNGKTRKDTGTRLLVVKSLWIIFIIFMIILLLYSMLNIIKAKQEYESATKSISEAASTFPAMTICPYQPFSNRAVEYFEKGGMSPRDFSQRLRRSAIKDLENNQPLKVENTMFNDDLRIYYQNIPYNDSINIGLNESEIFVFCITKLRNEILFGKADSNCGSRITRYSTPDFFNCYTINVLPKYAKFTEYIHLIIRFPKPKSLNKYRDNALLNSLSQNIIGAQLLVHEANSSPLSKTEKIHIGPNKRLQINYHTAPWQEYTTALDSCKFDQSETIIDLENEYKSSLAECLSSYNGKRILEKCGCVMAILPRSSIPSSDNPYCANFQNLTEKGFENFKNRSKCVGRLLRSLDKMSSSEKNCSKRCEFKKFILHISNINWEPNLWQLEWLYKLQESWNILLDEPKADSRTENAKKLVMQFLKSTNPSDSMNSTGGVTFEKDGKYAYIVLEKTNKNTVNKEQDAVLGYGGPAGQCLVSIIPHIVLLCVFIIEIVKSFVVICKSRSQQVPEMESKSDKVNNLTHQELE